MMTNTSRPDPKPGGNKSGGNRSGDKHTVSDGDEPDLLSPTRTTRKKPVSDGDAIAEVGDEVGGPA